MTTENAVEEQVFDDEDDVQPGTKACPHCEDFEYDNTPSGGMQYANHVRIVHPDQTKKAKSGGRKPSSQEKRSPAPPRTPRPPPVDEEYLGGLSPMAQRFYDSATQVVPSNKANLVKQMVDMFQRYAQTLAADRHRFRSWIMRYGLTPDQVNLVEDEMFGIEDLLGTPSAQSGMTPQMVPTPGGGYQQVWYAPPPGGLGGDRPINVNVPPSPAPPPQTDSLREEIREMRYEFGSMLKDFAAQVVQAQQSPSSSSSAGPMRRIPIMDDEGNILKDASGETVFQEIPVDQSSSMMDMFRMALDYAKPVIGPTPAPPVDEEKLMMKMREEIRDATPAPEPKVPDAIQQSVDEMRATTVNLQQQLMGLERERDITSAVENAVAPLATRLNELQTQSGLTDHQYELAHKERMAGGWRDMVAGVVDGVREDVKPMVVQSMASNLKNAGVPDEVIAGVLQNSASTTPTRSSALKDRINEAKAQWLKP